MTIESLGRRGGPKPGEHGVAAGRHSRQRQPETRAVPTARPKPAPPRAPLGDELRRAAQTQTPAGSETGQAEAGAAGSATAGNASVEGQPGSNQERRPAPKRGGQGNGKTEGQNRGGDRSLYDGGSPSANRLGPAKAMRARDVSRPRD